MILHFLSYMKTEMVQVVEISPQEDKEPLTLYSNTMIADVQVT